MSTISATLRAELSKLTDAQAFYLLRDLLQPGRGGPFDLSDDFLDMIDPITQAYDKAYGGIADYLNDEIPADCFGICHKDDPAFHEMRG